MMTVEYWLLLSIERCVVARAYGVRFGELDMGPIEQTARDMIVEKRKAMPDLARLAMLEMQLSFLLQADALYMAVGLPIWWYEGDTVVVQRWRGWCFQKYVITVPIVLDKNHLVF